MEYLNKFIADGWSNSQLGKLLGVSRGTVRRWQLDPDDKEHRNMTETVKRLLSVFWRYPRIRAGFDF